MQYMAVIKSNNELDGQELQTSNKTAFTEHVRLDELKLEGNQEVELPAVNRMWLGNGMPLSRITKPLTTL